jgi:hypothetical protein
MYWEYGRKIQLNIPAILNIELNHYFSTKDFPYMFKWFKKKAPSENVPVPDENAASEKQLFELQAELLAKVIDTDNFELLKNVQIEVSNGTVFIRQFNIEIICNVLDQQDHGTVIVYRLGFIIKVDGTGIFYEEMVALGTSPFVAILEGVTAYNNGFLNGFFHSFFGFHEPDFELDDQQGNKFHLIYSQLQVQGEFKGDDSLEDAGFVKILFPHLKDLFSQLANSDNYEFKDFYWIKIYLSRQNGDNFIGECRFNDQEWNKGLSELLEQDYKNWKKTDSFLAKKQFIFIKKCPQ